MRGERDLYREKIEVSLDGKQVFYLFFGGAVIASLVFVVGVMVGKRLESRAHADDQSRAEVAASDPLAALDMLAKTSGGDELSFPSELRKPRADTPVTVAAKPADDKAALAKAEQAKAEKAKAEKAKAEQAKAEKAKAEQAKAEKAKAKAEAKAELKKKQEAAAKMEKATAEKAKAAKAKAAAANAQKAKKAKVGKFTLQLSSFQSEAEADAFYDQLRAAGYRPYVSRAELPGKGTWFRVRLGKYATYDDAVAGKASFEKRQKIIAYVTRL